MKRVKKILVSVLALASISSLAVGAALTTPKTVTLAETATGLSQNFISDGTNKDFWDNKKINIPEKYYTTATIGGVETNVADLSGVKAMTFTVNNTSGEAFVWNIGMCDAQRNVFDNEWLANGQGSALFIPEKGMAYWGNHAVVNAGFNGRVVLPFSTMTYNGTSYQPFYNTHSNPVFKMRTSGKATGRLDTNGNLQSFPTATMNRYMTFYVNNTWEPDAGITFNNIEWLDAESETTYDEYLSKLEKIDAASVGAASNEIDMDGAVVVNTPIYKNVQLKMQVGGGTSVNSLNNSVGMAMRIRNYKSETLKFEWKLWESSSEVLYVFANSRKTPVQLVWKDGKQETIYACGSMPIPANFDGTAIIPFSGLALAGNPNSASNLDGRPSNNMWTNYFFMQSAGEFAIAEINQIYAAYDATADKTNFTMKPMKTAKDGVDVNYAKNKASWTVDSSATLSQIAGSRAVSVTETENGVESQTARTTLSNNALYYGDSTTLTIPVETGLEIGSVTVNGVDVTADIVASEGAYTYSFKNGELNSTETVVIAVNYVSSYAEAEYYVGGASVRYDWTNADKTGIRFQMLIKKEIYDSLVEKYGENFLTGTLIIPEDKLGGAELTKQTASVDDTDTTGKWSVKTIGGEEYMESWTYLYGIPEHSYNRGLSARGYLDLNGKIVYTDNTIVRSLAGVAYAEKNMEGVSQEKVEMLNKYLKTYTVQFADENGEVYSTIASQSVVYGEKISVPTDPTKDGFVFAGWTLNGKPFNPATDSVKGNMVLKATFVAA